jgi:hypothetical protein
MMVVNHHMSQDAIMVVTTQHDTKCPPNESSSWCAGYKAGYEINMKLIGRCSKLKTRDFWRK